MKIGMIKEDLDGQQWYNEDYVNEMMSRSYWEGFIKGIKIEFHAVTPQDDESVKRRIADFYNHISKTRHELDT